MIIARFFAKRSRRIPAANVKEKLYLSLPKKQYLDPSQFQIISDAYLNKIYSALTKLKEDNPGCMLHFNPDSLSFSKQDFALTLKKEPESQQVVMNVGEVSGHKYFYDLENERWVSDRDGHILDELLVRELLRACKGYLHI